jgi:hypothetical protein
MGKEFITPSLERKAIGTGIIPTHKFKANFLDYYEEFVKDNKQEGNRHLEGSFTHFKNFLKKDFLSPIDVTENLCERFRKYLLDKFNGGHCRQLLFAAQTGREIGYQGRIFQGQSR